MGAVERLEHHEIEGLRVGRFGGAINTTCILYRLGDTVIDTGPPNQWRTVRRFLAEREVRRVVVTHHHEDHSGNLARLEDEETPVYAPPESRPPLTRGFRLRAYQRIVWGRPARVEPRPLPPAIVLPGGLDLRPIATPGHSADMTCFLEPNRGWLFSGDLYIGTRTRALRGDEDLGAQLDSLRRVLELDFDTVLCSHRGVLLDGRERLRAKLDYLESLCQAARELRREGFGTGQITRRLLGREGLFTWVTGFHFSKRNLIEHCLRLPPDAADA
ncbi:MAG: MBL fold metallo-hydrolase [Thermoanaerobaculia bacterium]|nr:MBL fold metallo-hydrolase [Thermoanaerobaculia bacterium]